jgi:hypothetical protein
MLPLPLPLHAAVQALCWAALSARLGRAVCARHLRPCEAPAMLALRDGLASAASLAAGTPTVVGLPAPGAPGARAAAATGDGAEPLGAARTACHAVTQAAVFHLGFVAPLLLGWLFQSALRRRAAAAAAAARAALAPWPGKPAAAPRRGPPARAAALWAAAGAVASWVAADAAAARL